MSQPKIKYVCYIHSYRVPRHYHKTLAGAIEEGLRLSVKEDRKAWIVEYGQQPYVLGYVLPDGTIKDGTA